MKKIRFVHLLLGALVLAAALRIWNDFRPLPPSNIVWRTDYFSAVAEARRTHKPLLVEFYATWCSACRSLDRGALRDSRVEDALERFIAVRVDTDYAPASLGLQYSVSGIPALHVVSPDENILASSIGVISANELLNLLERAQE